MQRSRSTVGQSTAGQSTVAWLNGLSEGAARTELRACCAANSWVRTLVAGRPYPSLEALLTASDAAVRTMGDDALDQALAGHARIGQRPGGEAREARWSRAEQAAALDADPEIAARLAEGNRVYEQRFGRVFLIRASGRSAEEMYDALRTRLTNDEEAERSVVLHELAEIVRLRLAGLVTA
jgi:2-oxo-4-hydroxy-4-carboxy-5-ureidoimidazoline decarboxylase